MERFEHELHSGSFNSTSDALNLVDLSRGKPKQNIVEEITLSVQKHLQETVCSLPKEEREVVLGSLALTMDNSSYERENHELIFHYHPNRDKDLEITLSTECPQN